MAVADLAARKGANIAIEKVGQYMTYVRVGDGSEDLATGVVTIAETEYTLKGYETGIHHRLVDGTKIKWTDRMVLIDAVAFEAAMGAEALPSSDDRIKVGAADLAIVTFIPVSSGEQYALFKIIVRR